MADGFCIFVFLVCIGGKYNLQVDIALLYISSKAIGFSGDFPGPGKQLFENIRVAPAVASVSADNLMAKFPPVSPFQPDVPDRTLHPPIKDF